MCLHCKLWFIHVFDFVVCAAMCLFNFDCYCIVNVCVYFKLNSTWVLCGDVFCRIMLCRVMFTCVVLCPEYCCLSCVVCVHVNWMCMYMLM